MFDLSAFISIRPYVYHLTASDNIHPIGQTRRLESARQILEAGSRPELIRARRSNAMIVNVGGTMVHIRDQSPLHAGNCALEDGCTFEDLVEQLNDHVFFWPGTESKVSKYGERHFARYSGDNVAVIRVSTRDILKVNSTEPLFSRYNSGSPRCYKGHRSPRGSPLFRNCRVFEGTSSDVVEVVFRGSAILPHSVQVNSAAGWHSLCEWLDR